MSSSPQARVGLGVFIVRQSSVPLSENPSGVEFIIGKRLGSVGAETWALAGGHLEFGESFEDCATRETLEETGLSISNLRFLTAVNTVMAEFDKHYVTIFMTAKISESSVNREPEVLEKDKCEIWKWITWSEFLKWTAREACGSKAGEGDQWSGSLFSPLISLYNQRPGITPILEQE